MFSATLRLCLAAAMATGAARAGELVLTNNNQALPLRAGWAIADITPIRPVALIGQLHKRISAGIRDPLTATVLAIETAVRTKGTRRSSSLAISCSCSGVSNNAFKRRSALSSPILMPANCS